MLPQRADDPQVDGQQAADPERRSGFERDLRELEFPTTLLDLLPRPVRTRWTALLWATLVLLVLGLLAVRVAYLDLNSVKW